MGSTIYTEVFVLALVLISNVLGNNFVGYIPRTATEIAARLQVPAPKLLLQVRKFRQQMSLKYRVRAPSVFRHPLSLRAARLLKPSPVRRGLQPSQTGTVKGRWTYLYRAVDKQGRTVDFLLSAKRDVAAAKRFFQKAMK